MPCLVEAEISRQADPPDGRQRLGKRRGISCRREFSGHCGPPWIASAGPSGPSRSTEEISPASASADRVRGDPAFRPSARFPALPYSDFPEHDWNKESLSSNSFRAVGHRPDKFALSDPVEADAEAGGLRAIGAIVVRIEHVETGSAQSISVKLKAAAGWRGPQDISAAFAALQAFSRHGRGR